jgi:hypothetical protein
MTTIEILEGTASIQFSLSELYIVNNALNEVCNALDADDFLIRMGIDREEVVGLLEQIHTVLSRIDSR